MPGLLHYYRTPEKEQWDRVARLVERQGTPGDLVVLSGSLIAIPFEHYYRGSLHRFVVGSLDRVFVDVKDDPVEVAGQLKEAMVGHHRIWLIVSHYPPLGTAYWALGTLLPMGGVAFYPFVGVQVLLYKIPPHLREGRL